MAGALSRPPGQHDRAALTYPASSAGPFTLHGYDFTAQIRKHWHLIERSCPAPQEHTAFEGYLFRRVAGERSAAWIDQLELNVASRGCQVSGLLRAHGPDGELSGQGEAEWARFGQLGFELFRQGADAVGKEMTRMRFGPGGGAIAGSFRGSIQQQPDAEAAYNKSDASS